MLPARLAKLRAFRERLIAAVPDGHPLARHEKALTWAGLSGETILVQGRDDSQAERQFLAPFLGGEVSFSSHAASRQSILALVAANFGIAMVTESQAAAGFPGVTFRSIDASDVIMEVELAWPPETEEPAVGRFVAFIRDAVRSRGLVRGGWGSPSIPRSARCNLRAALWLYPRRERCESAGQTTVLGCRDLGLLGDVWAAFGTAEFARIVGLSLTVSLSATAVAAVVGLPCGAALAICRFPGRRLPILLANAFLGLPPVVVGLALYLILSRSGPLGPLALLFTPSAMVIAQALLAAPIVTALTHRAIEEPWQEYGGALRVEGASRLRSIRVLLAIARPSVLTAVLAGFGRTISEVGAMLIVGGNIAGYTRIMTTAIVLKTSEGDFGLALGLGFVLIGISIAVSASAFLLWER
jgi:tungstate transport system permease protein